MKDQWLHQLFADHFAAIQRHLAGMNATRGFLLSNELDDILQETFLALYENRKRLQQHPNIIGWLYKTARFKFLDHYRKQCKQNSRDTLTAEAPEPPLDASAKHVLEDCIEQIVETVGLENYNLLLRYFDTETNKDDLAAELGLKTASLRSRIHRIIAPLRSTYLIIFIILSRHI